MAFATPLFLPFRDGHSIVPGGRGLYLNAETPTGIDTEFWRQRLFCIQPWRDRYLDLKRARYDVSPGVYRADFSPSFALINLSKHKSESLNDIALANDLVEMGGPVVVGGPKRLGAASVKNWLAQKTLVEASFAKHHWQVFLIKAGVADLVVPEFSDISDGYTTAPGMFSHRSVDDGSAFLIDHFSGEDLGRLADFGCGWGYLSVEALKRAAAVSVGLIDAHAHSLQAATENMASHHPKVTVRHHWLDVASERIPETYDTIIMNPPFHSGSKTDVGLGISFIEKAASALVAGGQMFMVANRQLPYEQVLNRSFRQSTELASNSFFKLFRTVR